VGQPEALAVSVAMFPQASVVALLRRVASGRPDGSPAWPGVPATQVLRPASRFAAWSFADRRPGFIPDCVAPIQPVADVPVADQVSRLRELDPDVLVAQIDAGEAGCAFAPRWRAAAREPGRWLASLADASLDAWAVLAPQWRAAAPLLDREVHRVGTAMVRGGMAALLNSLHPRISYADGVLTVAYPHDGQVDVAQRRLALVPMIASRDAFVVSTEHPEICHIGYAVRPPGPGTRPAAGGTLALIFGTARAAALRALSQPLTVTELAAAIQCAPNTASYHLNQLTAAGLITRERRGTSTWISRTVTGDTIIELLSD
jgi:DNA-binding transcriptional ArsR family regulator